MKHENDEDRLDDIIGQAADIGKVEFDRQAWLARLAAQESGLDSRQTHHTKSEPRKTLWRTIMKSRATRYSVAATIIVAASLVLLNPFTRHGVVLAEVAQRLSDTRTVMHKEKRRAWRPGEDKPFYVGEVRKYISTDIGFMEEMYDWNGKLDHRYYLLKEGQIVLVFPKSKRYVRLPAQGRLYDELLKMSTPAGLVNYFTAMPYTRLGRSQFDGFEAEGFEIDHVDFSLVVEYIKHLFPIRNISATLWVEAETSLPAGIEMRIDADPGLLNGFRKVHTEFTAYDFEWDVRLPEGILDPNIPADYTRIDLGAPAISVASTAEDWTPTSAAPRLWPVDEGGNGHAYQGVRVGEVISWTFAEQAATLAGGYLATITSAVENAFVYDLSAELFVQAMGNHYGPWLGGYQLPGAAEPAGGWVWVTGEPFEYTAWAPGEPSQTAGPLNEDRIHYLGHGGPESAWNDQANSESFGPMAYVVEYDPVTHEAEEAAAVTGGRIDSVLGGYSGTGYVTLDTQTDGIVRWMTRMGMAGPKAVVLRYGNGAAPGTRVQVAVNGTVVEPNLSGAPAGAWDAWTSATVHAYFTTGENVVEVRSRASDAGLALDRITIYDDNTNLVLNRPVIFSTAQTGYPASQAVDADVRTCWRAQELPQWLEVDLGDLYPVYRTQLVASEWQACQFRVEVKTQAQDPYVTVVDRTDNMTRGTAMAPVVDTFEPTPARYVRLVVTGTDWGGAEIAEFRVAAVTGLAPMIGIGPVGYRSIQAAIDAAQPGDVITLQPGRYAGGGSEGIALRGKRVTLTSVDPNDSRIVAGTIIGGAAGSPAVSFTSGENADCVLAGLTVSGAGTGVYCANASPTIRNCRIVGHGGTGVELYSRAQPVIRNCIIAGNRGAGIAMDPPFGRPGAHGNCPRIINCTIVENVSYGIKGGSPTLVNSILYWNGVETGGQQLNSLSPVVTYCDVQGNWPGEGNLDVDPCFVRRALWVASDDPDLAVEPGRKDATWAGGDYHLQSQAGRWDTEAGTWVADPLTSPCLDAGDPAAGVGEEPSPNGGRIDLGAYGGTTEASMSP